MVDQGGAVCECLQMCAKCAVTGSRSSDPQALSGCLKLRSCSIFVFVTEIIRFRLNPAPGHADHRSRSFEILQYHQPLLRRGFKSLSTVRNTGLESSRIGAYKMTTPRSSPSAIDSLYSVQRAPGEALQPALVPCESEQTSELGRTSLANDERRGLNRV